jgi:hypothetical protein
MTNPIASIPVKIERVKRVKDLSSWLAFYGEPHPDKIPTGAMTTFEPLQKIVAGGKSLGLNAVRRADGRTWKHEFDEVRARAVAA